MKLGDRIKHLDPLAVNEDGVSDGPLRYGTVTGLGRMSEGFVNVKWDDGEKDCVSVMFVEVLDTIEGLGSLLDRPDGP